MERFYSKVPKKNSTPVFQSPNNSNNNSDDNTVRVEVEVSDDEIIGDPGLRKPIENYPITIRDEVRRRYLAKGRCQPSGHNFPGTIQSGTIRKFQPEWFQRYDWLEYSVSKDAAFCFWCYLFAKGHKHKDDAFTVTGFKNWKKGIERLNGHEGTAGSTHNDAKTLFFGFKNPRCNIDYVLESKGEELESAYRIRLTVIVNVVRLLLGQGLPFRGHDESSTSLQQGNFLEILKWYCEQNKDAAKVMNLNAPGNNQLTSPIIQKQIINACATETRNVILNEIGDRFFALLIDEARDSSVKEQMAVVLRFVSDRGEVIERFLGVVHVSDTSAKSLKDAVDDFFAKNNLSLTRLRGQGYDGASTMRGEFNGLKSLILR